jgi:hypothetical protein
MAEKAKLVFCVLPVKRKVDSLMVTKQTDLVTDTSSSGNKAVAWVAGSSQAVAMRNNL